MTVRLSLTGGKELQAALSNMSDDLRGAVNKVVLNEGMKLRGEIVRSVQQGPASGRIYQKYNPRRTHRASAPGQAPMTDTGRLASSVYFNKETVGGNMVATVGSALAYASWLEYGTMQMAARPYFRPALEERRPKFQRNLERAIAGEIR